MKTSGSWVKGQSGNPKGAPRAQFVMRYGYKYIKLPEHPNANKQGYIPEHYLNAENGICGIKPGEVAHHINGDRLDNSINNLMVLSDVNHKKLHASIYKRDANGRFN